MTHALGIDKLGDELIMNTSTQDRYPTMGVYMTTEKGRRNVNKFKCINVKHHLPL